MKICSKGFTFENCIYSPSDCGANCNEKIEVKMRNFDKIKNMSIEEMAEFIKKCDCENTCALEIQCWYGDKDCECIDGIKQWLQSESEE